MTPEEVRTAQQEGALVLDMRTPRPYAREHLDGAVNLQFNRADLVDRAELVLPTDLPLIIHGEPEAIARVAAKLLAEAGFNVRGHLEGGLKAWKEAGLPVREMPTVEVDDLNERLGDWLVVDARDGFEFKYGHVPNSVMLSWVEAWQDWESVPEDSRPIAVICGDEIRSSLVASILERQGRDAQLVVGGMVDWLDREYPIEKGEG
jgi:hydroxyacylglutathione hydrolase